MATESNRATSEQNWSPHQAAALLLRLAAEQLDHEDAPSHDDANKAAALAHAYVHAFAAGIVVSEEAFRSTLRSVLDLSAEGIEFHVRSVRGETAAPSIPKTARIVGRIQAIRESLDELEALAAAEPKAPWPTELGRDARSTLVTLPEAGVSAR